MFILAIPTASSYNCFNNLLQMYTFMTIPPLPRKELVKAQVDELGRRLGDIPASVRGDVNSNQVPWICTNDVGFSDIIPGIRAQLSEQKTTGKPRVALLSGVGSIASIASLPNDIDAFVSVDITDAIFSPIQRQVDAILASNTIAEYHEHYNQSELFTQLQSVGRDPQPYWEIEKNSFGQEHFLASAENFLATKKALTDKPLYFVHGNFNHKPLVDALGGALHGCDIPYASFTDLADWSPSFLDLLPALPLNSDTVVVWSQNKGQPEGLTVPTPVARYSLGVESYIADAKAVAIETSYQVKFIGEHK